MASNPLVIASLTFPFSLFDLVLKFLLPIFLAQILFRLLRRVLLRAIEKSRMTTEHKASVSRVVKIVFIFLFVISFAVLLLLLLGAEFFQVLGTFGAILSEPFFKSGELSISVLTIVGAIPVFLVAAWIGKGTRHLVESEVLRRLPIDDSLRFSLSNITGYSVMLLMAIIGLSIIGINFSSLVLIFGVLGIGIGFGLQNTVANFFAGLIIIMSRPITVGDFILANSGGENIEGEVVKITLLHSVVNTILNETIIIPNSEIINKAVHNLSHGSREIIMMVTVQVHYETDIDRVEELFLELARECPYWNRKGEASMIIRDFASSGVELAFFIHIVNASDRLRARAWLRRRIWDCFRKEGIVIPYPQLDLHVKSPVAIVDKSPAPDPEA